MNILITGGAGYIGSVLTEALAAEGHKPIVLDNLSQGHRGAVIPEAVLVAADIDNREPLNDIFQSYSIEAVMHLAASTSVANSMVEPGKFFTNNVGSGIVLLECMLRHGVKKLIFSSTAAVYGQLEESPVTEDTPTRPLSPYGESKLMFEGLLPWYDQTQQLSSVSFRFFNVAGASHRFGPDRHPETNLIPNIIKVALGQAEFIPIFGNDYDTKDGTCIRDYIHVLDIAQAHILALDYLGRKEGNHLFNLGNGKGYSVKEVITAARKVTGAPIPVKILPRRPGDPANLVASSGLATRELGWTPQHPRIENIIESSWRWSQEHPDGYANPETACSGSKDARK